MRALLAAIALLSSASIASAQDRVIATHRVDAWDRADLSWITEPTARVLVEGTLTCAIDGAEIDALEITTASRTIAEGSPLVFPAGTRLIERRGEHAYLLEVPTGPGASIALNVASLASRRLVTASELRESTSGAILVRVLGAHDLAAATVVPAAPASSLPLAGAIGLGVPLLALGVLLARGRKVDPEAALAARATRARAAIAREARVLGSAFDGALASAHALADAATHQRAHIGQLDAAIARTRWVRSAGASASIDALRARRAEARASLESIVAQLEDTVVRMAVCVADRSAIAGLERDLARARVEVEVGESVEQELARLG